jgi:tetratricopeptide (TPR) repeat protein
MRTVIFLVTIFGLLAAVPAAAADRRSDCANIDFPAKALLACTGIINSVPKDKDDYLEALHNRARIFLSRGQDDNALTDADAALAVRPHDVEAIGLRGEVLTDQGEYDRADLEFERALALDPNHAETYCRRGNMRLDRKNVDAALADQEKAISIRPDLARAYVSRGNVYYARGDYGQAIIDYDKAISLRPSFANAFGNRANAERMLKDYVDALIDSNKAIKLRPDLAHLFRNRAALFSDLGQYNLAVADYGSALRITPHDANLYNDRGIVYSDAGDNDHAIRDYTRAITENPRLADGFDNRANSYLAKGDRSRAMADYAKAIEVDPTLALAHNNLGSAYFNGGDRDRALAEFSRALELDPKLALAYSNRGKLFRSSGDLDRAVADFGHLIEIQPDAAVSYDLRGWTYKARGDAALAAADFERARELRKAAGLNGFVGWPPGPMRFAIVRSWAWFCEPNCPEWISAEGEIVAPSINGLKQIVKAMGDRRLPVIIDSPGGDVAAALTMGRLIRAHKLDVAVGRTIFDSCNPRTKNCTPPSADKGRYRGEVLSDIASCASACPLVLAGGVNRLVGPYAAAGIHGIKTITTTSVITYETTYEMVNGKKHILSRKEISRTKPRTTETTRIDVKSTRLLEKYLADMGVAPSLVAIMKATPYEGVHKLSFAELFDSRLAVGTASAESLVDPLACRDHKPLPACVDRSVAAH